MALNHRNRRTARRNLPPATLWSWTLVRREIASFNRLPAASASSAECVGTTSARRWRAVKRSWRSIALYLLDPQLVLGQELLGLLSVEHRFCGANAADAARSQRATPAEAAQGIEV